MLDDERRCPELTANLLDEGPEGFRLALGEAGGGLVQAEEPGVEGEQAGQLDDAPGACGEVSDVGVGVAPEAEEVDELVGLRSVYPLGLDRGWEEQGTGEQAGAAATVVPLCSVRPARPR